MRLTLLALLLFQGCLAQSVFTLRPDDPKAVYVSTPNTDADASADLQRAIDQAQQTAHHGIVFVPEGRYRIEHTVYVWAGIRLIGYGQHRPVFVLPGHTADFQTGPDHYMLWYTDERTPAGQPIADASEFTFYSALSNIDFQLEEGNPSAVAIRFNVAQHSFITHAEFQLGTAKAALEAVGNQASDIHVHGGQYGIITGKTSAAWQFLLMDSTFDHQKQAAISTHEAGFTLIRDRISNVPVAIEIPKGEVEQLYGRDLQFDHISSLALKLGDAANLRNEINLVHIACTDVARFVNSATPAGSGARSYVQDFSLGLDIGSDGRERGIQTHQHASVTAANNSLRTDIPALPPMAEWTNVHALGVVGDGVTDDTSAIQRAIEAHAALYFPSGLYRLTGSLHLRQDSTLIGFSPFTTQFTLIDADPHLQGDGPAVPLLIAPPGGRTVVTGFGISTGNLNPRACGIEWQAGAASMLEDTEFIRGHDEAVRLFAPQMPKAPEGIPMQLDAQYPSLWVHGGGGGIFRDNWSHAGTAKAGLLVEQTSTPGVIYQLSNEHHMQREVRFDHAANWTVYDLQTEEEKPEGADAVALEIVSSHDLLFANTYMYRVSRNIIPKLYAATTSESNHIVFANVKVFSQTRLAFDNSVWDQNSQVAVRAHHFSHFEVTDALRSTPPDTRVTQVATGFSNATGLTTDQAGVLYFTDSAFHTVYKFTDSAKILARTEQMPQVLGFVAPSSLLAVNWERTASSIDSNTGAVSPISARDAAIPGTTLLLPVGLHNEEIQLSWLLSHVGYQYRIGSNTATRSELIPEKRFYYYAPDSKTAIMTGPAPGRYAAWAWRPYPESSQLAAFSLGSRHYITSEDDEKTYLGTLGSDEKLTTELVIERGGTSVVTDAAGNIYIASGQVYVYGKDGHVKAMIEVPERPSSLAIGGSEKNTLFIGARSSVYSFPLAISRSER